MDLSIVVFDLRDAIEELREERAELLKRIEALEDRAEQPDHAGTTNTKRNECAQVEAPAGRQPIRYIQTGENSCNAEQPCEEGCLDQGRIIPPPSVKHQRLEALEAHSRLISQSGEGGEDEDNGERRSDQKNQSGNESAPLVCPSGKCNPQNEETDRHQWLHRQVERQKVQKSVECVVHTDILPEGESR